MRRKTYVDERNKQKRTQGPWKDELIPMLEHIPNKEKKGHWLERTYLCRSSANCQNEGEKNRQQWKFVGGKKPQKNFQAQKAKIKIKKRHSTRGIPESQNHHRFVMGKRGPDNRDNLTNQRGGKGGGELSNEDSRPGPRLVGENQDPYELSGATGNRDKREEDRKGENLGDKPVGLENTVG